MHAQSRQSAKLFLQSSELGLPQSLARRRGPPPFWGEGHAPAHSLAREGLGESQFRRGDIHSGTLYIYVLCVCMPCTCRYFIILYNSMFVIVCYYLMLRNFSLAVQRTRKRKELGLFYVVILSVLSPVSPTPCTPTSPLSLQFLNPLRPSRHSTCPPSLHPL
jgi:hypothetical protein